MFAITLMDLLARRDQRMENGSEIWNVLGDLGYPHLPSDTNLLPFWDHAMMKLYLGAKVAELADAPDLGSGPARGGGSSPSFRIF